jgi:hypothetical protein
VRVDFVDLPAFVDEPLPAFDHLLRAPAPHLAHGTFLKGVANDARPWRDMNLLGAATATLGAVAPVPVTRPPRSETVLRIVHAVRSWAAGAAAVAYLRRAAVAAAYLRSAALAAAYPRSAAVAATMQVGTVPACAAITAVPPDGLRPLRTHRTLLARLLPHFASLLALDAARPRNGIVLRAGQRGGRRGGAQEKREKEKFTHDPDLSVVP